MASAATMEYSLSSDACLQEMGEWTAAYNRHWGGLCLLDQDARKFIRRFSRAQVVQTQGAEHDGVFVAQGSPEERLLRQLALRRILVRSDNRLGDGGSDDLAKPRVEAVKINVIQLVLANSCNFGCSYCFEGVQGADIKKQPRSTLVELRRPSAEENRARINLQNSVYASTDRLQHQEDPHNRSMKPQDAVDYVGQALAIAKSSGTDRVMIQFFGGEPLLNFRAIRAVLDTYRHGENHALVIDYTIVTNGSLIKDEVAKTFADYKVGVCVSFDSPESNSRPLKNGSDSRPIVFKGLRTLQAHGVRVAMNVALSTDTWDTFDPKLIDFALDYGIHEIGVVVDLDPGFYSRFGSDQITEKVWSVVVAGRKKGVVITGYWHQIFQMLSGFGAITKRGFKNCSATGAQLSIEPNGSVFSCKAGSGRFGSIHDENLLRTNGYLEHAALRQNNPPFCHGCEIEGFCAGLCLGPREKTYGSINQMEPAACDFYRGIARKFIGSSVPYELATFELGKARR
jgi:uncharacterized protein